VEQSFPLCYFWSKVLAKTSPAQAADLLKMAAASVASGSRKKLDRQAQAWTPGTPPPALP
jgi:hypothetical protein